MKNKGFTLMELMIVVAIVAILASVALGSFSGSGDKARRAMVKKEVLKIVAAEEQWFVNYKDYTTDLTNLKISNATSAGVSMDGKGNAIAPGSSGQAYLIAVTKPAAREFTVTAVPKGVQAGDNCGTLTIKHTGQKTAASSSCW